MKGDSMKVRLKGCDGGDVVCRVKPQNFDSARMTKEVDEMSLKELNETYLRTGRPVNIQNGQFKGFKAKEVKKWD